MVSVLLWPSLTAMWQSDTPKNRTAQRSFSLKLSGLPSPEGFGKANLTASLDLSWSSCGLADQAGDGRVEGHWTKQLGLSQQSDVAQVVPAQGEATATACQPRTNCAPRRASGTSAGPRGRPRGTESARVLGCVLLL